MNYSHLLYKRGYLFSKVKVEPPVSTWTKKTIGDYFISFDPENPWAFLQEGNDWVAFLGRAIDTLHWSMDIHAIVRQCLDQLSYSKERMLDYIDHLSGRFILIYHHGNKTKFMTDAFGTRSTFYFLQGSVMIASHCRIISDYLNSSESEQMAAIKCDSRWYIPWAHAHPGILTPYERIHILTPNTQINIEERKIQRFYPRRELPEGNLDEVVEEASILLKRQLELLHREYKLALSLSSGNDSRAKLAAARDIAREVLFFTYGDPVDRDSLVNEALRRGDKELAKRIDQIHESRRKQVETDLMVASEIAEVLGLRHICLDDVTAQREDFQEFNKVMDYNTYHYHSRKLALAYLDKLPCGLLHIRSNISEVAKAYGRMKLIRMGLTEPPFTPEKMAQAWKQMGDNELVVDAFREFADVAKFANILNYDPCDMFLWEHHEGTWLSYVLLESDVAFDTFDIFNCRALMEKALSVPVGYRMESAIQYGIIRRLWPILLLWPINEPPFRIQLEELRAEHDRLKAELAKEKRTALAVQKSFSYRLGDMLVQAVASPGRNTILLPYRLIRLCATRFKKRKSNVATKSPGARLNKDAGSSSC